TRKRLEYERAVALGYAIDHSTHCAYSSHLQSYLTFCKLHGFPIEPTPDTLSFFTVYMSHQIKPSSVDAYLSGISNQLEPFFPHVHQARKFPLVARTLAGCKRMLGSSSICKRPISIDDIRRCLLHFNTNVYDDLLFLAILLASFLGLHRLGELVSSSNGPVWRKTISRTS
ncbi:hypothetical protein BDY19DRAFT_867929, partial [Irpex rosettiformis]